MQALKQRIVEDVTSVVGRHDQPALYAAPPGDPGLVGPGSVSWEIHADVGTVAVAGTAAITMELLHPSVMAGVHQRSSYREQPLRRARATFGYVVQTTFASTQAAERTISRVRRMHERVSGTRPDGEPYRAMDPELLGWVHTAIPWAIMRAFERYRRPLTSAERDRYLAEQAVIGRLAGAGDIPVTAAELDDYLETMRPKLAVTEPLREFFDFLLEVPLGPTLPRPVARAFGTLDLHASLSLLPGWARRLIGVEHPAIARALVVDPYLHATARTLRWAFGTPPWAALAHERTSSAAAAADGRGDHLVADPHAGPVGL